MLRKLCNCIMCAALLAGAPAKWPALAATVQYGEIQRWNNGSASSESSATWTSGISGLQLNLAPTEDGLTSAAIIADSSHGLLGSVSTVQFQFSSSDGNAPVLRIEYLDGSAYRYTEYDFEPCDPGALTQETVELTPPLMVRRIAIVPRDQGAVVVSNVKIDASNPKQKSMKLVVNDLSTQARDPLLAVDGVQTTERKPLQGLKTSASADNTGIGTASASVHGSGTPHGSVASYGHGTAHGTPHGTATPGGTGTPHGTPHGTATPGGTGTPHGTPHGTATPGGTGTPHGTPHGTATPGGTGTPHGTVGSYGHHGTALGTAHGTPGSYGSYGSYGHHGTALGTAHGTPGSYGSYGSYGHHGTAVGTTHGTLGSYGSYGSYSHHGTALGHGSV